MLLTQWEPYFTFKHSSSLSAKTSTTIMMTKAKTSLSSTLYEAYRQIADHQWCVNPNSSRGVAEPEPLECYVTDLTTNPPDVSRCCLSPVICTSEPFLDHGSNSGHWLSTLKSRVRTPPHGRVQRCTSLMIGKTVKELSGVLWFSLITHSKHSWQMSNKYRTKASHQLFDLWFTIGSMKYVFDNSIWLITNPPNKSHSPRWWILFRDIVNHPWRVYYWYPRI